ncbi:MAG: hypothetical protein RR150_08235 [Clostridia bacterium]
MAERADKRMMDIRTSVCDTRKPVPIGDMADWLLRAITGGDVRAYAEVVRERATKAEGLKPIGNVLE